MMSACAPQGRSEANHQGLLAMMDSQAGAPANSQSHRYSQCPAVAKCDAASASRYLRAGSRAVPASAARCFDGIGTDEGAGEWQAAAMILNPSGARVWLAAGHTDMRKGFDGLALLVQETLKRDPRSGHLFVFRGRRDGLIKVLWLLFDRIGGGGAGGRGLERGQDRRQASQHPACDSTDTFP